MLASGLSLEAPFFRFGVDCSAISDGFKESFEFPDSPVFFGGRVEVISF